MDKAMELVEQLAIKLGVAAEYLWAVLIKQQYADGIVAIVLAVFLFVVLVVIMTVAPKLYVKYSNEYEQLREDRIKNGTGYLGSHITSSVREDHCNNMADTIQTWSIAIGIAAFILIMIFTVCGVKQIINPEYYALKEVLNAISAG
jgi:hypothetical protein